MNSFKKRLPPLLFGVASRANGYPFAIFKMIGKVQPYVLLTFFAYRFKLLGKSPIPFFASL
ncbi:TPA: hypothetical protein ACF0SP_002183 [Streptococcus agalactiae]|uniref:hypothetical protein n=1 Tax=Streptococcus agalactiae TaxID=1311 RepID=UPI0013A68B0A|nr:hypothetical protein [Streptococcus agalactiae]